MLSIYQGEVGFAGIGNYTFANPELTIQREENIVTLNGIIEKYTTENPNIADLGFPNGTNHLVALELFVENADNNVTVALRGDEGTKNLTGTDFDVTTDTGKGIYLVLDGNTKEYELTIQANENEKPLMLTILNEATLGE